MNHIGARAVRCDGQFLAQFRKVHKADWEMVQENGKPALFPTEDKAELEGWKALAASGHLTSLMTRDGETINGSYRAAVEARYFTRDRNGKQGGTEA